MAVDEVTRRHRTDGSAPARAAGLRLLPRATAPTPGRCRRAFALVAVAYLMTMVDLTIVNVALPTIGRKLHVPTTTRNLS